jgi:3'-phosphoadenosine 5'-phosphosulfate sulfotransferase
LIEIHVKSNLAAQQREYRQRNFRVDDLVKNIEYFQVRLRGQWKIRGSRKYLSSEI